MPIDASIPLQTQPVDPFATVSKVLGIQKGKADVRAARAHAQQEEQTATQRANLADFDWQSLNGDDGTIDLNKLANNSDLKKAAGDQYPQVLTSMIGAKQQQIGAIHAVGALTAEQQQQWGAMVGALRSDPDVAADNQDGRKKVDDAMSMYQQMYPQASRVIQAYAPVTQHAPQGKLAQALQNIQMQADTAASQLTRQGPQYTSTGAELKQTNPYAPQGASPSSIPLTIHPGQQAEPFQDQLGNWHVGFRDQKGNFVGSAPMAGPPAFGAGEKKALEDQANTNAANVFQNRQAAASAPQLLDQVHKAHELATQTQTGHGSELKQKVESAIGSFIPGFDAAKDDAAKYDLLNKFLERVSADSATVLGKNAGTDAARASIKEQFGHTGQVNTAIQKVLEYTESQIAAVKAKGDAQEKWLANKGNGGIVNAHQFETAWRQAYDPVLFQLQTATPEERKKIVQGLSKEEAASLKEKRAKLRDLGAFDGG